MRWGQALHGPVTTDGEWETRNLIGSELKLVRDRTPV